MQKHHQDQQPKFYHCTLSDCDHKGNTRISNLLHYYKNKHPELADEFEIWLQGGEEPFPPPTAQGQGTVPQDDKPNQ